MLMRIRYSAPFRAFGKWYSFRSEPPVVPEGPLLERVPMRSNHLSAVMPALVAGIHVFLAAPQQARRRWPGQAWTSPAMTPGPGGQYEKSVFRRRVGRDGGEHREREGADLSGASDHFDRAVRGGRCGRDYLPPRRRAHIARARA